MDSDVKGSVRRHVVSQAKADVFARNGKLILVKIPSWKSNSIGITDFDLLTCLHLNVVGED